MSEGIPGNEASDMLSLRDSMGVEGHAWLQTCRSYGAKERHWKIMPLITIRQKGAWGDSPNAAVSFDRRGEFPVTLADPFSAQEETDLEWYFEEHLKFPFTRQVEAKAAAESVTRYGVALFEQVFKRNFEIYGEYQQAKQAGVHALTFEIIGAPDFHRLHWEALKDPALPEPFAVHAPMVRSTFQPPRHKFTVPPAPLINLLVVTARPRGKGDIGYRTISRPLVEGLRAARIPVNIEILRPGTYQALVEHLTAIRDQHQDGYYHIIHFDLHGALRTYSQLQDGAPADKHSFQNRFGRQEIAPYEGRKAFLAFEKTESDAADQVEAGELADLLLFHRIPIAILNACQSGKQTGDTETSLGSRLLQAGVQTVLAMGYSVTVSAAALLMQTLYQQLFQQNDLARAICQARFALFNRKARQAYYNQQINLEDWLLPVVYQSGAEGARLPLRPFGFEEQAAYYAALADRYRAPEPTYGFVGRDVEILEIEKRLLRPRAGQPANLLLLRGMGGAGKTTLLRHLGEWWQTTRFVAQVFYFGYDEKAWTLPQIMDQIAQQLFPVPAGAGVSASLPLMQFRAMPLKAQPQMLAQQLRSARHLLILDNLESITGAALAIRNTLPPAEQAALAGFLAELRGGQTLVLLGSRSGEEWLMRGPYAPLAADAVYDLPGLDAEAASALAERILERQVTDVKTRTAYRQSAEFARLLQLLDGYPLPLEIVLANLRRQTPAEILAALQAGAVDLDAQDAQSKTASILKCIDYSHSNLSPDAQTLLLCLAPFTGVMYADALENYTQYLRQQPALADLPFDQWPAVLQEAAHWGLLTPHEVSGFLHLQPIFPYFLRTRLEPQPTEPHPQPLPKGEGSHPSPAGEGAGVRSAIETAFRQHYDDLGDQLFRLLEAKEPQQRQMGQLLTRLEYENLHTALHLALVAQVSILNPYKALSFYLDTTQDQQRGLVLGQTVLARLENYSAEILTGQIGAEFAVVLDDIAKCQLLLKQYAAAEVSYQKALSIWLNNKSYEPDQIKKMSASIYHQLGYVAQEQRQWAQVEQYYQQALALFIEFNDRYGQAATYHQLGYVAQEQGQWAQAEEYYQQALALKIEFNDRYAQAMTYHQLGRVAQEQRQWVQAEQYYQQAFAICIEFNDRYHQALIYHQLGSVAQEQRQWAQAEQYYQQALAIDIEFNDRYEQAGTYHQLGSVAEEQQQWAQAQAYFLQALEIFVEFEDEYYLGITLRSLARLWQASVDGALPAAVAAVLGVAPAEVEQKLQELGIRKNDG